MGEQALSKARTADKPAYQRMTVAETQLMLKLRDDGLTQVQIAQRLGRAQSTISDALSEWEDSTDLARRYFDAQALRMAKNVVENGQPRDHNVALAGRNVLKQESSEIKIAVGVSLPGMSFVSSHGTDSMTLSPPPSSDKS